MAPRKIPDLIVKRTAGHVKVSVTHVSPKETLPRILLRLGIQHQGREQCTELDAPAAKELLNCILVRGLAYGKDVMPFEAASELVDLVMSDVFPSGASLLTNLDGGVQDFQSRSYGLMWTTQATFSIGVVAVGRRSAACLWVEEED